MINRVNIMKTKIEETIHTIINQFHRKTHNFFNEHEFHNYCYHVFYSKKEFSKQYVTLDGKKTNILHPEYPTLKRFRRDKICIDPKGVRARYDMAILNPEFIQKNTFEKIRGRDISLFEEKDFTSPNLIAAIEFKFIIKHSPKFKHEIKCDLFKLSMVDEVMFKYMLVFANTKEREIDYFREIDSDTGIKIAYVCVYEEGGRKKREVRQIPEVWV